MIERILSFILLWANVQATSGYYFITQTVDGDTIKVTNTQLCPHPLACQTKTVRLIGLDTPESVDPRRPVQCFGKEASKKMHELAYKKKVRLEADPTQDEIDKYGRWLRYVYLENGTLVNQWMIEYGYGHEYTYKSNPYKFQDQFKASEDKARRLSLGLWSPSVCNN